MAAFRLSGKTVTDKENMDLKFAAHVVAKCLAIIYNFVK